MPEKWTGEIVGELHCSRISKEQLAAEVGWHPKYLSQVLCGHKTPKGAEEKLRAALERIIENKNHRPKDEAV